MNGRDAIKILIVGLTTVLALTVFNKVDFKKEILAKNSKQSRL